MLLPFALWGTAMAAMRPLLESGSPLQVASLRLLPAGVLVLLAALLLGRSLRVAAVDWPWLLAFALVDGSLFQGLLAQGLGQTGAGLGSVLIDSQPLLVALLARSLFGEAINPVGWVGCCWGCSASFVWVCRHRCCATGGSMVPSPSANRPGAMGSCGCWRRRRRWPSARC
jgi:EamA-like transporter family.